MIKLSNGMIVSGSYDNTIILWDINTYQSIQILNAHKGIVISIIELSDGRLVSGSCDGCIMIWNKNLNEENNKNSGYQLQSTINNAHKYVKIGRAHV